MERYVLWTNVYIRQNKYQAETPWPSKPGKKLYESKIAIINSAPVLPYHGQINELTFWRN